MKGKVVWVLSAFILVSFVLLFDNSDALAVYPYPVPPTSCTLTDTKAIPKAGYTISIWPCQAGESCTPGEWPIKRIQSDGTQQYQWRYIWSGIVSAGQISTVVPICEPQQIIYYPVFDGTNWVEKGYPDVTTTGDPTTNFGVWTSFEKTIRIPQVQAGGTIFGFNTKSDFITPDPLPIRNTYLQLKSGNSLFYCRDIAGPDCPGSQGSILSPIITTTDFELRNPLFPDYPGEEPLLRFRYVRGADSCILQVKKHVKDNQGNWSYEDIPWEPASVGGHAITKCATADASGKCENCLLEIAGSPHFVETSSSSGQLATLTATCQDDEKKVYGTATGKFAVDNCRHNSSTCPLCGTIPKCGEECCTSPKNTTSPGCVTKTNAGVDCHP